MVGLNFRYKLFDLCQVGGREFAHVVFADVHRSLATDHSFSGNQSKRTVSVGQFEAQGLIGNETSAKPGQYFLGELIMGGPDDRNFFGMVEMVVQGD